MAYLQLTIKVALPEAYFDAATTAHEIGVHFKTFVNAMETAGHDVVFEPPTTEPGEIKPAEPRRRGPDKNPRKPVLSVITPTPEDEPA